MSKKPSWGNAQTCVAILSISSGVFIAGVVALSYLPIPISLSGGLRTDWISVSGKKSDGAITITTKAGQPTIVLHDASGNRLMSISTGALGGPEILFESADGDRLITMNAINDPTIRVYDPDTGAIVWEAAK